MTLRNLANWLASRPRRAEPTTIVMHATAGGTLAGALQALRQRELSYHYLIDRDGTITKCVPYTREAFHAGESFGPLGASVNRYSIGISFVNRNDGRQSYTDSQYRAARALVAELKSALPSIEWITTHYDVAPSRKTDPRGFDIRWLAKVSGLDYWGSPIKRLEQLRGAGRGPAL